MLELVERELNWILDSPVFFARDAHLQAPLECQNLSSISLPGPIVSPNNFEFLSNEESANLISSAQARRDCAEKIFKELQTLHTGRLGLVFEKYLEQILASHFGSSNVSTRVPVRQDYVPGPGSKTWGEFDFLLLNSKKQRVEHWESSIKFYLQVRDEPAWKWCWGPGVIDRLDLKGPKTFLQQLSLSSTLLGQNSIPTPWRELPLVKRVFAKGTIFYSWKPHIETFAERLKHISAPCGLSGEHLKSWWIHPHSVAHLEEHYRNRSIAILPRRYWMTGLPKEALPTLLESWSTFREKLELRSKVASERKECLYVAIYSTELVGKLECCGFIATPHFINANSQKNTTE